MSDQQSTRKDGWYWVRVIGANKSEPGKWYSSLQEFAVAGGGFKESELAEIGPRIPSPYEKPSPEASVRRGRPWIDISCGGYFGTREMREFWDGYWRAYCERELQERLAEGANGPPAPRGEQAAS